MIQLGFIEDFVVWLQNIPQNLQDPVVVGLVLFLLSLAYIIISRSLSSGLEEIGLSGQFSTGISLILRLIFVVIGIILVVNLFDPAIGALLSLSTVFGTALGLAFSQAVSEIVNGLYILIARPFRVGDYVRIANDEGIVTDVNLYYTRIQQPDETRLRIPNSKVLSSDVVNFRVDVKDVIKDVTSERLQTLNTDQRGTLSNVISRLKSITHTETAYRYTFDLTIHHSLDHVALRKNFDKVCEDWEEVFLVKPNWQVWDTADNSIIYRVTIIVDEPRELLVHIADLMNELLLPYRKKPTETEE
jgi:small-conductance mechanosensitive channel